MLPFYDYGHVDGWEFSANNLDITKFVICVDMFVVRHVDFFR